MAWGIGRARSEDRGMVVMALMSVLLAEQATSIIEA
jgi:hypothetical protein